MQEFSREGEWQVGGRGLRPRSEEGGATVYLVAVRCVQ